MFLFIIRPSSKPSLTATCRWLPMCLFSLCSSSMPSLAKSIFYLLRCSVICNLICILIFSRIAEEIRTLVGLFFICIIFIITTVFIEINSDTCESFKLGIHTVLMFYLCKSGQEGFFELTLGTVVTMSVFSALLQGSVTGAASVFPPRCMHAMVAGQGKRHPA